MAVSIGQRVEVPLASPEWSRGDRYGLVERKQDGFNSGSLNPSRAFKPCTVVWVRLEKSGKTVRYDERDLKVKKGR